MEQKKLYSIQERKAKSDLFYDIFPRSIGKHCVVVFGQEGIDEIKKKHKILCKRGGVYKWGK